jgi:hypothetical protein
MQFTDLVQRSAKRPSVGAHDTGRILELGTACRATIVRSQPLGMRHQTGDDLYALVLTISIPGRPPSQIQISDQVSVAAISLLHSGNTLPAKHMPGTNVREVAIDWALALAQVAETHA